MNQRIKKLWVKALRSGEYKQGKGRLRHTNQHGTRYCCLGVLTDVYCKEHNRDFASITKNRVVLPNSVRIWAGLDDENPTIPNSPYCNSTLANINDSGEVNFHQIATLIEEKL